jgi:hypothetical protein
LREQLLCRHALLVRPIRFPRWVAGRESLRDPHATVKTLHSSEASDARMCAFAQGRSRARKRSNLDAMALRRIRTSRRVGS